MDELMIVEWLGLDPVCPQPLPAGGNGFTTELCLNVLFELAYCSPGAAPVVVADTTDSAQMIRARLESFQQDLRSSGCSEYPASALPVSAVHFTKASLVTTPRDRHHPDLYAVVDFLGDVGEFDARLRRWYLPPWVRVATLRDYDICFGDADHERPHYLDHLALEALVTRLVGAKLLPRAEVWLG